MLRKKLIESIIRNEKIRSQEQLRERLMEAGVRVTQATLSRDLQTMNIVKVFDSENGYVYAFSRGSEERDNTSADIRLDLMKEIKDIKFSGNLAVVKTKLGYATGVAFEIDRLNIPDIVGTIGGDDTLLVVLKEESNPESFLRALRGTALQ